VTLPLAFGWRHQLFANGPVDPGVVEAHLPEPFDVSTYDGDAWLSVIPFVNVDVRLRGLPAWVGVALPELNLRTYVTRDGEPGVYFFSLDADGLASTIGARLSHHLPYFYADVELTRCDGGVSVRSRRRHPGAPPARFGVRYEPAGQPFEADRGSLAAFLTKRRRLWTVGRNGAVRYTDVAHEPWRLYAAEAAFTENTLFAANRFELPGSAPTLYYSPGVDVRTSTSTRWAESPSPSPEPPIADQRRPTTLDRVRGRT
jgi:uncharacterized protein YqjF (DUF2071 family)